MGPHQLDSMLLMDPLNVPDQSQVLALLLAPQLPLPIVPHQLDSMRLEPLNVPDQSQMLLLMLLLTLPLQLHAMLMEIAKVTIWSAVKPPLKPTLNSKVTMKPLSIRHFLMQYLSRDAFSLPIAKKPWPIMKKLKPQPLPLL